MISDMTRNWRQRITQNRVFRSIFRHSYPDDARTSALVVFSNVFLHLHPIKIRKASLRITYTFCLGGLSFFLFLLLTVTGVLLMFYYRPAVEHAYQDMKDLETVVGFGMMLRNIHRYSAHGMVITVFLHMIRVFYTGAYKAPREFNWVVGVVLFTLTLLLSFTGYLLPWDQLAFWAITVGTNMVGSAPGFGGPDALHVDRRLRGRRERADSFLRAARHRAAAAAGRVHGRALLADPQGWRHRRTAVGERK